MNSTSVVLDNKSVTFFSTSSNRYTPALATPNYVPASTATGTTLYDSGITNSKNSIAPESAANNMIYTQQDHQQSASLITGTVVSMYGNGLVAIGTAPNTSEASSVTCPYQQLVGNSLGNLQSMASAEVLKQQQQQQQQQHQQQQTPYYLVSNSALDASTVGVPFSTNATEILKKCHLHSKPQLTCKFCRKYRSLLNQQPHMLQTPELYVPANDTDTWAIVEMTNTTTYNVNSLLRENILSSEYFKSLFGFKTCQEISDEICNYADHAEPYCARSTRAPSTLFCCLYKLFTMRLKHYEIQALLDNTESPYVRCVGFLYLRYVLPPDKLWDWFSPYFLDDDSFSPGIDKQQTTTIGEYAESLMTEDRYFSTVLPRIPVKLKSQYGVQLISMPSHRRRRAHNKLHLEQFKPGTRVAACCNGQWIEGSLLSVEDVESSQAACQIQIGDDEDNIELVDLGLVIILDAKMRQFKRREERKYRRITFGLRPLIKRSKLMKKKKNLRTRSVEKDASSQTVLATEKRLNSENTSRQNPTEAKLRSGSQSSVGNNQNRSRSLSRSLSDDDNFPIESESSSKVKERVTRTEKRSAASRSPRSRHERGRNVSPDEDGKYTEQEMMREFRRREQAKVLASGRDYARRPTSYKSSLSLKFSGTASRRRERSPPVRAVHVDLSVPKPTETTAVAPVSKVEPSREHQRRMAQLVERYSKPVTH